MSQDESAPKRARLQQGSERNDLLMVPEMAGGPLGFILLAVSHSKASSLRDELQKLNRSFAEAERTADLNELRTELVAFCTACLDHFDSQARRIESSQEEYCSALKQPTSSQQRLIENADTVRDLTKELANAEKKHDVLKLAMMSSIETLRRQQADFSARIIVETALRVFLEAHLRQSYTDVACQTFLGQLLAAGTIGYDPNTNIYYFKQQNWSKPVVLEHFLHCCQGQHLLEEYKDPLSQRSVLKSSLAVLQRQDMKDLWQGLHRAHHCLDVGDESFIINKKDRPEAQSLIVLALCRYCYWSVKVVEGENGGTIYDSISSSIQQSFDPIAFTTTTLPDHPAPPPEPEASDPTALTIAFDLDGVTHSRRFPSTATSKDITAHVVDFSTTYRQPGRHFDIYNGTPSSSSRIVLTPGIGLPHLNIDFTKKISVIWR